MADDSLPSFSFPATHRRKVSAAFDGARLTSDGGVLLLTQADCRLDVAGQLARCVGDPRGPDPVIHSLGRILRTRILAIACGYEDANDLDTLRHDLGFKLAPGKLSDGPIGLASQPTMSGWENAPTTREIVRLSGALVDIYCASYPHWLRRSHSTSTIPSTSFTACRSYPFGMASWRALLPSDPCLRHVDRALSRDVPSHRQDAIQRRDRRPYSSAHPSRPPPLASHPRHPARRWPLWPSRADGVVRKERCRLCLSTAGQCPSACRSRHRHRSRAVAPLICDPWRQPATAISRGPICGEKLG